MKKLLILLGVFAVMALETSGLEPGKYEYPCHFLKETPALDGREDKLWNSLPWQSGFLVYANGGTHGYAVEKPSSFKAGWTKDSLYILVKCYDMQADKLKSATLWDNGIEVFICPVRGRDYFQLVTNISGRKWGSVSGVQRPDELKWTPETAVCPEYWLVEMRIPFDTIGKIPVAGEQWSVNIARNSVSAVERYTCWPPLGREGYHDVGNFGKFIFCEAVAATRINAEGEVLNSGYRKFLSQKVGEIIDGCGSARKLLKDGMKYRGLQEDVRPLMKAWDEAAKLSAGKTLSLETMGLFLMDKKDIRQVTEKIKYKIQLEQLLSKYSDR